MNFTRRQVPFEVNCNVSGFFCPTLREHSPENPPDFPVTFSTAENPLSLVFQLCLYKFLCIWKGRAYFLTAEKTLFKQTKYRCYPHSRQTIVRLTNFNTSLEGEQKQPSGDVSQHQNKKKASKLSPIGHRLACGWIWHLSSHSISAIIATQFPSLVISCFAVQSFLHLCPLLLPPKFCLRQSELWLL